MQAEQIITTIRAELTKRRSAYPKIINKARNQGKSEDDITDMAITQKIQYELLECVEAAVLGQPLNTTPNAALAELRREMTMRKKVYKHWVSRRWMTPEKADKGLAEWQAVIDYFTINFQK